MNISLKIKVSVRTSKAFNYVDVTAGQQAAIFSIKDLYYSNTTIIQGKEAVTAQIFITYHTSWPSTVTSALLIHKLSFLGFKKL